MKNIFLTCSKLGVISKSWEEGVTNKEGGLNEKKWAGYMRLAANYGANCTRELPFWITGPMDYVCSPFVYLDAHQAFDVFALREKYFQNLKRMVNIANQYNIVFIFDLFDYCGAKGKLQNENPWTNNINRVNGFWDNSNNARAAREKYIDAVIHALSGTRYILSLGNEMPEFAIDTCIETYLYLENKYNEQLLIHGVCRETKSWDLWHKWEKFQPGVKGKVASVWHGIQGNGILESLVRDSKLMPKTRPLFFSFDGDKPRPTYQTVYSVTREFVSKLRERPYNSVLKYGIFFEVLNHKGFEDNIKGLSLAYKNAFDVYPDNWERFPDNPIVVVPPDPEEPPIDEKPEEAIDLFDKIKTHLKHYWGWYAFVLLCIFAIMLFGCSFP